MRQRRFIHYSVYGSVVGEQSASGRGFWVIWLKCVFVFTRSGIFCRNGIIKYKTNKQEKIKNQISFITKVFKIQ